MPQFAILVLLAGCANSAPPIAPALPPVAEPSPVSTISVTVPSNCAHLILDVDSSAESSLLIACFDGSNRTFYKDQRGPPVEMPDGRPTQIVISYAGHDAASSTTR